MAVVSCWLTLAAAAMVALLSPVAAYGQSPRFDMKVFLGPMNELEVDAQYHDPSDIDAKLKGTRVIPMWLVVRNRSTQPVRLDYQDLHLDLGRAVSAMPLYPIGGAAARAMLRSDGRYDGFLGFLTSQSNDYEGDPFLRVLRDGRLNPGDTKSGLMALQSRQ